MLEPCGTMLSVEIQAPIFGLQLHNYIKKAKIEDREDFSVS